jgi:signal transduction histidine kinase
MLNEKNITKIIIITPIITVILISFFTTYFFIQTQNSYFEEESDRIENNYIIKQKNLLKKEVDSVINYINYATSKNKNISKELIQKEVLKYIETIRYDKYGYLWVHDTSYNLLAHPFRQDKINTYDINLTDATGTLITKKFINQTLKNPNGVFIEYYWQKPKDVHFSPKLGFFKLYKKYSWVIGTGLYIDDIQNTIYKNKKLLESRIGKYIKFVIQISIIVIIIFAILSFLVSRKIVNVLDNHKQKVIKKELLLEDMNKNLALKVQEAIYEIKQQEKTMIHQARLARMGVMLSLIAHQWRQPLSKISAKLMELETATKFKKLDEDIVYQTINSSNSLLMYMSNTIDDFRNFFNPDKQKIEFFIMDAINEAISLMDASIVNLNITFIKNIQSTPKIFGYKREFAQVILNILSNAKDILHHRKIQNPQIKLSIKEKNKYIYIYISDNGGGIDESIINLIFDPYFTTKEQSKGTGLGLYISKMIIEDNMGAQLEVKNIDNGVQFCIKIGVLDV